MWSPKGLDSSCGRVSGSKLGMNAAFLQRWHRIVSGYYLLRILSLLYRVCGVAVSLPTLPIGVALVSGRAAVGRVWRRPKPLLRA